jgi:hypothetical protein
MDDREATEAEATDTGSSLFNFALMGIPLIVFSLLAAIAALASSSVANVTYQIMLLCPSSTDTPFGRTVSVVKADNI